MYTIGEFSRIANLSVKALRYYDEQGLLSPSRHGENNYRLYSETDFDRANHISFLRDLGFGIAEIKEILSHCEDPRDLGYYFSEKKAQIEKNIKEQKKLVSKITHYLQDYTMEVEKMNYEMTTKTIPSTTVASIHFNGKYEDMGEYFGKLFGEVKGAAAGAPSCLYHDTAIGGDHTEMEICVPVNGPVSGANIVEKTLPEIHALCTVHNGPYETIHFAYKALMDYAKEHGYELGLPWREEYIKGPGMIFKGNKTKYITNIYVPIEG